ncbi:MAG: hypothetical protein Q8843_02740 [Candidatus Phytoplasma australasiaticum]|nr:hypothetical protein [Candidatus Phytoplasma australasiaticum]
MKRKHIGGEIMLKVIEKRKTRTVADTPWNWLRCGRWLGHHGYQQKQEKI